MGPTIVGHALDEIILPKPRPVGLRHAEEDVVLEPAGSWEEVTQAISVEQAPATLLLADLLRKNASIMMALASQLMLTICGEGVELARVRVILGVIAQYLQKEVPAVIV